MKNKILKGSIIAFIFIICLMFITVGVSAESNSNNGTTIETLSKGGLSITYPSNWGYSEATSNYSIMAISKLDSIDAAGVSQVNINHIRQCDSSFKLISSGDSMIAGKPALEYIYTSNDNGLEREHKAVWFEKGGQAYVIMYSAPLDQFESNLYVFDYIISDIQIT